MAEPADPPARSSSWRSGTASPSGAPPVGADADDPSGNLALLAEHGPPPLDAWSWGEADAATVRSAVEELTARCMAERGFTLDRGGPDGADGAAGTEGAARTGAGGAGGEPVTHWSGFLGLVSLERAAATGYQVLDAEARLAERARLEQEASRPPDPAYVAALTGDGAPPEPGVGDDGCSGWAFDQVTPVDPGVDAQIQERLYGEALDRAARAPEVVRALDAWTRCMERSGWAIDAVPVPASTDPPTREQVEQAVADVRCKDETGLVGAYVTALYGAERELAEQHRTELDAFAAWGRERVRLATQVLGR